ncbi:MAG: ornithine cyclodeaminase family protein [Actinomycetota bacterium]
MNPLLVLTDAEVGGLIDDGEAIEAVESAFLALALGMASMPSKVYLDFPHRGDLRAMPAALGDHYAGVKLVNSHPGNPGRGLPVVMGTYLLFLQQTGEPLCLMGATLLTAIRTGAASGVASRYLARADASSVGLVGSGVQALHQLRCVRRVRSISEVVVWAPADDAARRDALIATIERGFSGIAVRAAGSVTEAAAAGIVCTTTPSRMPVVLAEHVGPGTHINAVGADGPGKQELDPAILQGARVIVDEMNQAIHGGEVNVAFAGGLIGEASIAGTLGEVIAGTRPGRTSEEQLTVFDSTGLAIQDIAIAIKVYERAVERGLGTRLEL